MLVEAMIFLGETGLREQYQRAFWADKTQMAGNSGLLKLR
jgi:hypothetical protein